MPIIAETLAIADVGVDPFKPATRVPQLLPGLRSVVGQYDGFIVDLWGVVHDGHSPFPHSAETLSRLKSSGKKVALLSNAPRRSWALQDQLSGFGIPETSYDLVLSSGDCVRTELIERTDPAFAALGKTCHHIGPERDVSLFDDVDVARVPLDDAAFLVNTGPIDMADPVEVYDDLFLSAVSRGLPMVCANPDRVVIRQGKRYNCAGALADRYVELGGDVLWRGKPDAAIYLLCAKLMGCGTPSRVAVIGDALETDMRGAVNAGMNGIWITGGIHAKELDAGYGKPADPLRIARVAGEHGLAPTAALSGFIW